MDRVGKPEAATQKRVIEDVYKRQPIRGILPGRNC